MAAAAESLLKSGEVSAMIKQGFISSPLSSAASSSARFIPRSPSSSPPSSVPPTTNHQSSASASASPTTNHPSSSPAPTTLFDMIAQEDLSLPSPSADNHHQQRRLRLQDRVSRILAGDTSSWGPGDVELSASSADGFRISVSVHRRVLAARSRFFAENLGRRSGGAAGPPVVVDICECDDVEVYVEVVAMMYCGDLRRRLAGEEVRKVLGLLKVSAALVFDAGVAACLEYLEAVPWSEAEEEEVTSVLGRLQLHEPVAEVLRRVSVEPSTSTRADAVFLQLLSGVLQAKDEKARKEMKALISGLFIEDNASSNTRYDDRLDVSGETLYHLCHKCLNSLHLCLSEAVSADEKQQDRAGLMGEIAREADNVQWLVEILISKKMADEFVMLWADQTELAALHSKIRCVYRYEISRITAQLCIALGRGQILVPKDARFSLLQTWLEALYDDFGWMKRACRSFDKKTMEDGLCQAVLTLPMVQQQEILLRWFDRFLKKGDDCPNIQRAFEVWWRRAFVRRYAGDRDPSQLQIAVCNYPA